MSGQESVLERFLRDISEIKVSVAKMEAKVDNINERLEVINHNTTDNAQKIALLEQSQSRSSDFREFWKRALVTLAGAVTLSATITWFLTLLGLHL